MTKSVCLNKLASFRDIKNLVVTLNKVYSHRMSSFTCVRVCVWLYNCVFYMYVCLGVVFFIIIFH